MKYNTISQALNSITHNGSAAANTDPMHVLWLHSSMAGVGPLRELRERLVAQSMCLTFTRHELGRASVEGGRAWRSCDLILIHITNESLEQIKWLVSHIRRETHAPIMLLPETQAYEWSLSMLRRPVAALGTALEKLLPARSRPRGQWLRLFLFSDPPTNPKAFPFLFNLF